MRHLHCATRRIRVWLQGCWTTAECRWFKLDNPYRSFFYSDFNVHNPDWICSTGDKDAGGIHAEEMCEMFGLNQLIDFPTRGENTLDPVMTIRDRVAIEQPGAGTSDHIAIAITLELDSAVPSPPVHKPTFLWQYAPWLHIRGAIKRELATWNPNDCESVDAAEIDLDDKLFSIIKTYMSLCRGPRSLDRQYGGTTNAKKHM